MSHLVNFYRQIATATPPMVDPFDEGFHLTITSNDSSGTGLGNLQIATRAGFTFNFSIDWGDGIINTGVTASITHTYAIPGVYKIKIIGQYPIPSIGLTSNVDVSKFLEIKQWGNIQFSSFNQAFRDAPNIKLKTAQSPIFIGANVSMERAFNASNKIFTGGFDMNAWDVSKVSNMFAALFNIAGGFGNARFDSWNVSSLTNADAFANTAISVVNYDLMLNAWANLPLKNNVIFDPGVVTKYSSAGASARQFIINTYGWQFQDGGQI